MIAYILLIISFFNPFLDEQDVYPKKLTLVSSYKGSKLLVSDTAYTVNSFLCKPNWLEEEEVLYSWEGLTRTNAMGIGIGNDYITDAITYKNQLILAYKSGLKNSITIYNNDLTKYIDKSFPDITQKIEDDAKFSEFLKDKVLPIRIGKYLLFAYLKYKNIDFDIIADNVDYIKTISLNDSCKAVVSLFKEKNTGIVNIYDDNGLFLMTSRVELANINKVLETQEFIIILSSNDINEHTFVQVLDKTNGNIAYIKWLNASINNISTLYKNNNIIYTSIDNNNYYLSKINIYKQSISNILIDNDLYNPTSLKILRANSKNDIVVFFQKGVLLFSENLILRAIKIFENDLDVSGDLSIKRVKKSIVISSNINSYVLEEEVNKFWYLKLIIFKSKSYIIPIILIIIIIVFVRKNNRKRRMLSEIFNLQSSGVIISFDDADRLIQINRAGLKFLEATEKIPLKKSINYYFTKEALKDVKEFIKEGLEEKIQKQDRVKVQIGEGTTEWLCTLSVMRNLTGQYKGIVFSGIDITEQLEKKRLANWAQLAHDMQTNLSTIRLNAENLTLYKDENIIRRQKILHQNSLLMKRVRDIVTVGRGDTLNLQKTDAFEICYEARMEFDDAMFPNVNISMEAEHFQVYCDSARLIRAIRNAVENGIKALSEERGKIKVSAWRDGAYACFAIKDTGKGMDAKVKQKMMDPYFTTAEGKGGFGIGTMIIQRVVEQHNGSLIVNSELGKGTEIILKIPNFKKG